MENKKELNELMDRLDKSNQQQAKFARLQCIFSAAAALCCAAVLIIVLVAMPKVGALVERADTVIADAQQVSSQLVEADWDSLINSLEQTGSQLAEADLGGLAEDVSELVSSSQSGVEDALKKLNAIDLDTLNKAIEDLADVVEPLAKFFNRFG